MNGGDKKRLLEKMSASHSSIQSILEGVDLELRIYGNTGWRIRDILGHIATWDREVTKSLRAFLEGTEYYIPGINEDETDFNEEAVAEQRELSTPQIVSEWEQAREEFKTAVRDIPPEWFPGDLLYPWGDERGSISLLVEYMIEHDEEHRDEIVMAFQAQ